MVNLGLMYEFALPSWVNYLLEINTCKQYHFLYMTANDQPCFISIGQENHVRSNLF